MDVAVTVTGSAGNGVLLEVLYVFVAPLALHAFAIAPQEVPANPHVTVQLTPLLFGSLLTVAVSDSDWPTSTVKLLGLDVSVTVIPDEGDDAGSGERAGGFPND
jgi:hypothetical protein